MNNPTVGIIMGSDFDLPVMQEASKLLDEFGIVYEINVVSAHRTPDWMFQYANDAVKKGLKVIIAGAGGSAHLPGMTAALTTLPVIGVPIKTKSLDGLDSLLSIVQMPPGIPVATVGINGAKNAALLAIEILATGDEQLAKQLTEYRQKQKESVLVKTEKLKKIGYKKYLSIK